MIHFYVQNQFKPREQESVLAHFIIKYSGKRVKDAKQVLFVIAVFVIVALALSAVVFFSSGFGGFADDLQKEVEEMSRSSPL